MRNAIGNLIRIALNLLIALASIVIFTILILPIQKQFISPSVWVIFDFFHQCLIFLRVQVFASFSRFIPRGFCCFCDGKWNCLLNFSKLSLLVYRITKFIIVYNELPDSLMSFSSLLVAPLGFSMYSIM